MIPDKSLPSRSLAEALLPGPFCRKHIYMTLGIRNVDIFVGPKFCLPYHEISEMSSSMNHAVLNLSLDFPLSDDREHFPLPAGASFSLYPAKMPHPLLSQVRILEKHPLHPSC